MSSLAQVEKAAPAPAPAGGVHFVAAARYPSLCADLRARRYLVVPVTSSEPGGLRQAIDDAVEGALAMRGALPPGIEPDAALEPTLRDQVFRARALGAIGLALTLPQLGDAHGGALDVVDGATLSAWLTAARRAPLLLVLDEQDRGTRVLAPMPIGDLAGPSPLIAPESVPPSGEIEVSPRADAEAPPGPPPPVLPRHGVMKKRSLRVETPPTDPPEATDLHEGLRPVETRAAPSPEPPAPARPDPSMVRSSAASMASTPPIEPPVPVPTPPVVTNLPPEETDLAPPPPSPIREGAARRAVDSAVWRQHALDLDKARGPKPVSVIERLFAVRYMPLLGAIARGEADAAVRGVVDTWRTSFEHSYREAFAALRVTGKRPPMVFDAPDLSARLARLNGARAIKLLLVDAMRFDVGERVAERLEEKLAGRAICVERMLLWSALPTNTQTQLALLARGPDGLRDSEPASEPEPEIVRGRAVGTVRRDRVGSREVMKLDLVEARLRNAGPGYEERIEALADEVAPILVKYVETLPPRTLVFLFADHGFRLPASADGRATGPATQGGVSPEEVLVPAQAWLLGGVH